MSLTRIYAILVRQYFIYRHHPTRLVSLFVWASIDVLLWGFITKYLSTVGQSGFDFTLVLLSAVVMLSFFGRSMQGVAMTFMEEMWSSNYLNIFSSPITISEYLAAMMISSLLTSSAEVIFVALFASVVFGLNLLQIGWALWAFLMILFVFGVVLGNLSVAMLMRFGPSAEWLVWPITAILTPFTGVFYSVSILPKWMQIISYCLPSSYVFEGLRGVLVKGYGYSHMNIILGLSLSLLYLFGSYMVFRLVFKQVIRNGLLARPSAEGA